jgi:hypothetical protein
VFATSTINLNTCQTVYAVIAGTTVIAYASLQADVAQYVLFHAWKSDIFNLSVSSLATSSCIS